MWLKSRLTQFFALSFKTLVFIWILLSAVQTQYCPSEKSEQLGSLITWYTSEPKTVISDPPCINDRYEISKRNCTKLGKWIPPKASYCRLVQRQYIPKCPHDFISKNGYCIYISKPRNWRPKCPFPNNQIATEHLKKLLLLNLTGFWLPVKRNQPFGKFVWYHPGKYGLKYKHSSLKKAVKDQEEVNDCIIVTKMHQNENGNTTKINYETKIVNCDAKYRQVCIYDKAYSFSHSATKAVCFSGKKNTCYTLEYLQESHEPRYSDPSMRRSRFCERLATAPTQLENFIIKSLVGEDTCWIGLKRNNYNMFQWENSQNFLEYTDWQLETDFNNPYAAIMKYGWELREEQDELNCGVCEIDITKIEINLTLKPDYKHGLLILTVYSPKYFINKNKVTCSSVGVSDIAMNFTLLRISKAKQSTDRILNQLSEKDDREVYFLIPNSKFYNYYTCKGIVLPNGKEITTENVLFGKENFGNEYAIQMRIEDFCNHPKKCDPLYNDDLQEIINKMNDTLFHLIRPMKVVRVFDGNLEIILHIHIKPNNMSRVEEYNAVRHKLITIFNRQKKITFVSLKSAFGCVEHVTHSGNMKLHWDFTEIGSTTMPQELCFNSSGLPVTKTCLGDFISGVEWTQETQSCSTDFEYSLVTKLLHDIYLSLVDFTVDDVVTNLTSLTVDKDTLLPSDIYYVSQILKGSNITNYNNGTLIIDNTVTLINNLIGTDMKTLKISTELLNSTNIILDALENLLGGIEDITLNEEGIFQVVSPYLFYQVSDLSLSFITGVAMRGNPGTESFLDYSFEPLDFSTDINELIQRGNLEVASFIPEEIIGRIKQETELEKIRVYISIFYNNSLFVEEEKQGMEPGSKIISISIMGYDNYLVSPIPVLFRNHLIKDFSCSYWRFGHSTYEENYPAKWAQDGGIHCNTSVDNVEICGFTHLTHFALLLGEPSSSSFDLPSGKMEYHDKVLSVITMIGCILSVLGIGFILLTALFFKTWRNKTGSKVLLNLSASVVLEMFVIFLADTKKIPSSETRCIILGCLLHYATLASFCWMLVVAYLQYLRFVKVFSGTRPRLVLKSCLVGWVMPLIPVVSLLLWDPNSYNPMVQTQSSGLCYPHGTTVYITVLFPIATILIINISIFCIVIYSITQKTVSSASRSKSLKYNQLKLAILLFFLLGLTWVFGFLTVFKNCLVCLYLFCSTATAQGFVLFIFYVLLDTNTRKLWVNAINNRLNLAKTKTMTLSNSSTTQETNGNNTNSTAVNVMNRLYG